MGFPYFCVDSLYSIGVRKNLLDAGITVLNYEASMADAMVFDWAQVRTRIDGFMESVRLKKLKG